MPNGVRQYVLTLNNWTEEENNTLLSNARDLQQQQKLRYLVIGKEVGASGTPHLQGFVQFFSQTSASHARRILGVPRLWMEAKAPNSTPRQAADYAKKDGDFIEIGEINVSNQGNRSDLAKIKEEIDNGATMENLWEDHFSSMVQYRRGFAEYSSLVRRRLPRPIPKVFVFWGPSGTGKTRRAWEFEPQSTWTYPGGGWFDGYSGQRVALFDEFEGSTLGFDMWKKVCDRYALEVPIKGGYVPFYPEIIVFTSNFYPKMWWDRDKLPPGWLAQFERRITKEIHMETDYIPGDPWINLREEV